MNWSWSRQVKKKWSSGSATPNSRLPTPFLNSKSRPKLQLQIPNSKTPFFRNSKTPDFLESGRLQLQIGFSARNQIWSRLQIFWSQTPTPDSQLQTPFLKTPDSAQLQICRAEVRIRRSELQIRRSELQIRNVQGPDFPQVRTPDLQG